jgi:hypothetical protein
MRLKADGNLDLDWRKRGYRDPQKGCYHELRSCVICNSAFELQARCPDRHPPPSGSFVEIMIAYPTDSPDNFGVNMPMSVANDPLVAWAVASRALALIPFR